MLNLDQYIEGGRVKREKIAMDIKYGVIKPEDITSLVSDSRIRNAFIGSQYADKKQKPQWNRQYLDELSYGVTAEGFNEDYLRYLCDVASFVRKQDAGKRKRGILWGIVAVVIIIGIIVAIVSSGRTK